jgi:hypothetical protein
VQCAQNFANPTHILQNCAMNRITHESGGGASGILSLPNDACATNVRCCRTQERHTDNMTESLTSQCCGRVVHRKSLDRTQQGDVPQWLLELSASESPFVFAQALRLGHSKARYEKQVKPRSMQMLMLASISMSMCRRCKADCYIERKMGK